jgi:DNA-binding response OmpR family regulator
MQIQSPNRSILLVEDDAFTASLLRFLLERQQMQVTCVANGQAALDLMAGERTHDLVVLDLMLPQVSGMDVLLHMKRLPGWADVPVLVCSALDAGAEVARAFRAGAADYVTKPFNPEELLARLNRLLAPGRPEHDRVA